MDDLDTQDSHEELSKDDLEVLQTFHDLELSTTDDSFPPDIIPGTSSTYQSLADQSEDFLSEDDMLALFATEADEDITSMRLAIQRIEQSNTLDSQGMKTLKRCAHKIAGTAAAIGCASMSAIARHIETIIKLVEGQSLSSKTTVIALTYSVQALEVTLQSIVSSGFESKNPLLELEEEYQKLDIDVHSKQVRHSTVSETTDIPSSQWFEQQTHALNPEFFIATCECSPFQQTPGNRRELN